MRIQQLTARRSRKMVTRCHSLLSSLSARILSRFSASVSSQRNSSMNVSIDCKYISATQWKIPDYLQSCFVQLSQALHMSRTIEPSCQGLVGPAVWHLLLTEQFSTFLFAWTMIVPRWQSVLMLRYGWLWYEVRTLTEIALISPTSSRLVGICASGFLGSKCGALLYVDMRLWVAKLMTCARQLEHHE